MIISHGVSGYSTKSIGLVEYRLNDEAPLSRQFSGKKQ
jgi:hypothetical protein